MTPLEVYTSNVRWRRIFAALALVVPALLAFAFLRQQRALDALADHGKEATAVVTGCDPRSNSTQYVYVVDGTEHTWSVASEAAPYDLHQAFPITVLPEDPSFSRPGFPFAPAAREKERSPGIVYGMPIGFFVFFAGAALLCHRGVVRANRGLAPRRAPLSPRQMGLLMAALLFVLPIGVVNLDAKSSAVMVTLFGTGVAARLLVTLAMMVLGAPVFVLSPALMELVTAHTRRGGELSRWGIILSVARAPVEQRREQRLVVATTLYFVVVLAAWIAFTAWRGV